ncbi:MAG TPA: AraC family transcriptional regulator [Acidimicrobiia bacterium]|nr:AraC family transcriptional regulator [Acidimicrobiia bacterium]
MQTAPEPVTGTPPDMTAAPVLDHLRLDGAIFLRAEYTEPWAYQSLDAPGTVAVVRPGSRRLTMFHVVADGRCWVSLPGGERHWAAGGDVIVLPYGDQHCMGGTEPADVVSISNFLKPPPWDTFPVLSHGAGGNRTGIVCGYLASDDPLFDPGLRALPPLFIVHPDDACAQWVSSSITYAMSPTATPLATRLPELLLAEVLRIHLASAPAVDHGWLAALRDPVLAPALAQLHAAPERRWTVEELASTAAVSRSLLDDRFRRVLGRSPIRYLADWRMHVAEDLLATTELSVYAIARRVGYDSEAAFSRAFKRARDEAPSSWRARRRARS